MSVYRVITPSPIAPKALEQHIREAIDQVRDFPEHVAKESGVPVEELRQATDQLARSFQIEQQNAGLTPTGIELVIMVLPTALKVVDDVWDHFILPWLKSKYGDSFRKEDD